MKQQPSVSIWLLAFENTNLKNQHTFIQRNTFERATKAGTNQAIFYMYKKYA
jgi:hypothetical protein